MTILIDSDVLIEISRDRDKSVVARWRTLAGSDSVILCSPVSAAELWTGARPEEHTALTSLFRALRCVPIDYETGRQAGEYLARYRKSHGVEIGDALIAATAVLNQATLWTRNRKHYPMGELTFY